MEGKKTLPVFSLPIASRLMKEGYVLNHTARNRNNRNMIVYYFRNVTRLKEDIQRFKREIYYALDQVHTIAVERIGLAQRLLARGYKIHHLGTRREDHRLPVFYFVEEPCLQEFIDEYLREVNNAKR